MEISTSQCIVTKSGSLFRFRVGMLVALILCSFFLFAFSYVFAQDDPTEIDALTGELGPEGDILHARKLYDRSMYDFAASQLERFLNSYPNHSKAGEAALLLANALREQGMIQPARNAYERASIYLTDSTRAVEALSSAADMDLLLGDTTTAINRYLAVQVLYPNKETLARTLIRAGQLQLETRQWQASERTLSSLLREYPGTEWESEARLLMAQSFAGQGDLIPALEEARGVAMNTRNDSLKVAAGLLLGRWELKRLDPKAAENIWTQVLAGMPDVPFASEVALELARLSQRSGNLNVARDMFDRASRMAEDSSGIKSIQREFADLMFQMQRIDFAQNLYIAADSAGTLLQQAWCADRLGNTELAAQLHSQSHLELEGLAKVAAALSIVDTLRLTDPDAALALIDEVIEEDPGNTPLADDLLWIRAELLAETGHSNKSITHYLTYAEQFPVSSLAEEARQRASYLRDFILTSDPSDEELMELLGSFGDSPGDPMARVNLAEYYLKAMKRPVPAIVLLVPLISRNDLPDRLLPRIQQRYGDAVWMEWQFATHNSDGGEISVSDSLRAEAESAIERLSAAFGSEAALHADPIRSWRVNRLREATSTMAGSLARMQRAMWDGFLHLHPDSKFSDDARLRLAEAFATKLDGDVQEEIDSLRIAYLDTLSLSETKSSIQQSAQLRLHRYFISVDSSAQADSLARVVLNGVDSPKKLDIARYWFEQHPVSAEASTALQWLANETWYHPDYLLHAPTVADNLLGLSGMSWDTHSSLAGDEQKIDLTFITKLYQWELQLQPDNPAFAEAKFAAGNLLLLRSLTNEVEGQILNAILDYTSYLKSSSDSEFLTMVALRLARLYDLAGHWELAQPYYLQALDRSTDDPSLQPLRRTLARMAFSSEQYDQANQWAKDAANYETDADTSFSLDELAIVSLYRAGKLERAAGEASAFAGWYKDHPQLDAAIAHFELERGRYHSKQGQYNSSLKAYKAVMNKYEETIYAANGKYELARDYMEQGESEKAYEMLIDLSIDHPEHEVMGQVYWLLGNYYASEGKYFEAFNKYEAVLADSAYIDSWPYVLGNQVRAFKDAGFYEGAMRAARQYLELYPDATDAFDHRMNLALSYHETGHYDLAISQFRRAMTLADGEDYPACQFYIAEALERAGRLNESVSEYMRVVHLNRPSKLQWGITALYSAGKVLERMNEPERAKSLYREIVAREGMGSPFGRRADEQVKRLEMFEQEKAAAERE
jgi:TolA-binding protein